MAHCQGFVRLVDRSKDCIVALLLAERRILHLPAEVSRAQSGIVQLCDKSCACCVCLLLLLGGLMRLRRGTHLIGGLLGTE
jgi:hypothetical protein